LADVDASFNYGSVKKLLVKFDNTVIPAVSRSAGRNAGISAADSGIFPKNGKNRNDILRRILTTYFFADLKESDFIKAIITKPVV